MKIIPSVLFWCCTGKRRQAHMHKNHFVHFLAGASRVWYCAAPCWVFRGHFLLHAPMHLTGWSELWNGFYLSEGGPRGPRDLVEGIDGYADHWGQRHWEANGQRPTGIHVVIIGDRLVLNHCEDQDELWGEKRSKWIWECSVVGAKRPCKAFCWPPQYHKRCLTLTTWMKWWHLILHLVVLPLAAWHFMLCCPIRSHLLCAALSR